MIAYNYSKDPYDTDYPTGTSQDFSYHGAHPYMNLWEGNVGYMIAPDNTWGSSSHSTYFRNYINNTRTMSTDWGEWAMDIEAQSRYHNFVGNVIGVPGMSGYTYETACSGCNASKVIWRWGCKDQGGATSGCSTDPRNTAIIHGNYDYVTKQVHWDSTISDHTIPNSYYLSSKPVFFGGIAWPIIGSDLNPLVADIPAKLKFEGKTIPGVTDIEPPKNLRIK